MQRISISLRINPMAPAVSYYYSCNLVKFVANLVSWENVRSKLCVVGGSGNMIYMCDCSSDCCFMWPALNIYFNIVNASVKM